MRYIQSICIGVFLAVVFVTWSVPASAHLAGQPPFFKINGTYSGFYPVQSNAYIPGFTLPQDIAPEPYLVNQPINFQMDTMQLQTIVPEDVIKKTTFRWDFGDGNKAEGLTNAHIYTKIGTYFLTIYADTSAFEKGVAPQLLQSVLLYILPNKDYQLPRPLIRINGVQEYRDQTTNTLENVFEANFSHSVHLDGSGSVAPSSRIVSYLWDLDNGDSSKLMTVDVQYPPSQTYAGPILRVTDENGFMVDTTIGLKHNPHLSPAAAQPMGATTAPQKPPGNHHIYYIIAVTFLVGAIWLVKRVKRD